MRLTTYATAAEFLAAVGPTLAEQEAEHHLVLGERWTDRREKLGGRCIGGEPHGYTILVFHLPRRNITSAAIAYAENATGIAMNTPSGPSPRWTAST